MRKLKIWCFVFALACVATVASAANVFWFGRVLNVSYTATSAITSDDLVAGYGAEHLTCFVFATTSGTVKQQYVDLGGTARDLTAALAVAASTLTILDQDRIVPKSRLIFTPDSQPGTVTGDCYATTDRN